MTNSDIRQSSILEAFVLDRRNENGKLRPVLVITVDGSTAIVVCISTSFDPDALTADEIELPYGNGCKTGLTKPSVAVCKWIDRVQLSDCKKIGSLPAKLMVAVADRLRQLSVEAKARKT